MNEDWEEEEEKNRREDGRRRVGMNEGKEKEGLGREDGEGIEDGREERMIGMRIDQKRRRV